MRDSGKLPIAVGDSDSEFCIRCGSHALDTGWECNECGYDNMPHYYPDDAARAGQGVGS